jgi:hypothetical protein
MNYREGQQVRVTGPELWHAGETGTVEEVFPDRGIYLVRFADNEILAYYPHELASAQELYEIELSGEDSVHAVLELTDAEAQTVRRVIDALQPAGQGTSCAPGITMKRKGA